MIQGKTARQTSGGFKALLPMAIFLHRAVWNLFLTGKIRVDLLHQRVGVYAMHHTGLLHGFAAGGRASEAMHAHIQK